MLVGFSLQIILPNYITLLRLSVLDQLEMNEID